MSSVDQVVFSWPISSQHGWGIRGIGMALNYDGIAVSALDQLDAELPPDDPRWPLLRERVQQSQTLQLEMLWGMGEPGTPIHIPDAPVFVPLGNDLTAAPVAGYRWLRGAPHIACPVFEDEAMVAANIDRLKEYDAVVVASRWNQDVLDGLGVKAALCHEGIDPLIFHPGVRKPRNDGRFRVFSGGKAEWRKGQDLVLQAFKLFAEKHDDAVLVAAWGSPFSYHAQDFEGKWEHGAPPGAHIGRPNFVAWAQRAGIKPHQIEIVEPRPNWQMAEVYGSCDVALFPNRREGGTNFVAMECMACGVPCALSARYGHLDLGVWEIREPMFRVIGMDYRDESSYVEEMARWLGASHEHLTNETVPSYWTWARHCSELQAIIAHV